MDARRFTLTLGAAIAVMLVVAAAAPFLGSAPISISRAFARESPDYEILIYARLPRIWMAAVAGAALSVAGVIFQSLLRDALATPYTLGVSSGASLGAVLAIAAGWREAFQMPAVWLCAIVGAGVTLMLVLAAATENRRVSSFTLLLSGVTVNSICLALILFLQSSTTFGRSLTIMRWLMGGIEAEQYQTLIWLTVLIVPVLVLIVLRSREWNLMAVGEEWAASRGIRTQRTLLMGFFAGSLLAGSITAFTGPIGFVGLIVPHALRLRLGADHRLLLAAAPFVGAAFLVACDTVARTAAAPAEIPVGVITALMGGPFFIWLLRSKRRSLWI